MPRLPTGLEAGVNINFTPGIGMSSGFSPELILTNVPKKDIIGGYKEGFRIIYDK